MTRRTTLFYCYLFLIYTFCVHLPSLNVEVFYMHLYNKEQAIKRMNQLGQLHRPFIFIINYLQDVSYIEEVAAVDSAEVLYNLNGFTNQIISAEDDIATYSAKTVPSLHWQPFAESFSSYQRSFNIVRRNILAGNSFLTNLTCRTPVETNLTLKDIYFHSDHLREDELLRGSQSLTYLLWSITILILLLAAGNFLLIRIAQQDRDSSRFAIHKCYGASNKHLFYQLLGEIGLQTGVILLLSCILTYGLHPYFIQILSPEHIYPFELFNLSNFVFVGFICLIMGIICSILYFHLHLDSLLLH